MFVLDALTKFPKGKKAYFLHGDPSVMRILLKNFFPNPQWVDSSDSLGLAAAGTLVVKDCWEDALDYVSLPKSNTTYVLWFEDPEFAEEGDFSKIKRKFSASSLPRIECVNADKPAMKAKVVEFLQIYTKLSEDLAMDVGKRLEWVTAHILHFVYVWQRMTDGHVVSKQQATNLIQFLAPADKHEVFVDDLLHKRLHKVSTHSLDTDTAFNVLSEHLLNIRLMKEALPEKLMSTIVRMTGFNQAQIKYYTPLAKVFTYNKLDQWTDAFVWCYNRKQHKSLDALVAMVGGI